jgi:hypothetical protein
VLANGEFGDVTVVSREPYPGSVFAIEFAMSPHLKRQEGRQPMRLERTPEICGAERYEHRCRQSIRRSGRQSLDESWRIRSVTLAIYYGLV